ncbi:GPI-specific phospholipase A2-like PGAP3 [Convolutriloba macropyga]|uniref:GPI-specific phospholipase A2-like PGAP3 n=1 Tax=Convolutriloba macropyga TaxID=536237 RepID=UPI003F51B34E
MSTKMIDGYSMTRMATVMVIVLVLYISKSVESSWADRHPFYKRCLVICESSEQECNRMLESRSPITKKVDSAFGWTCLDECKHRCMWNFTHLYVKKEGIVPKFFGRWPLIRYFGMLEPASSLASFASLLSSMAGFWWLRGGGGVVSPYQWCYRVMFGVNCFTWTSSTLFHIRPDLFILERMDYYGAFVSVFIPLFWFVCRNFYMEFKPLFYAAIAFVCASFVSDVLYMELVKFDHTLHWSVCTAIAVLGFGFWIIWVLFNFKTVPHSKYYLLTYLSFAVGPLTGKYFEWQPPYKWIYDAHSMFHILTSPTPLLFWWTIAIDDAYLTSYKQKVI